MRGTSPNLSPIDTHLTYRAMTAEAEGDSQSSSSNSPARADDAEESDFYAGNNDSQSSIGVPTFQDMAVSEVVCQAPVDCLPAEVLITVFAKLASPTDLLSCMLVSKRWSRNCVDLLWHRPAASKWDKYRLICNTLSTPNAYFAYHDFIKRINLASLSDEVNDGSVEPLMNCSRVERLTLTLCRNITDQGLQGLLRNSSHLLALDISGLHEVTEVSMFTLADHCKRLQGLNVSQCKKISNESLIAVASNCKNIKRVNTNSFPNASFFTNMYSLN